MPEPTLPNAADAGDDQVAVPGTTIILGRADLAFSGAMCFWEQRLGTPIVISNTSSCLATFTAPLVDTDSVFVFDLTVRGGGLESTDSVSITILPSSLGLITGSITDFLTDEPIEGARVFIELAADINEQMPYYVAGRIMEALNSKGRSLSEAEVLVLGAAYKKDVDDIRESPALKLMRILRGKGANVTYNDPHVPALPLSDHELKSLEITDGLLSSADCVVIATDHTAYDYEAIADLAGLVFDTRGVMRNLAGENVVVL